MKSKYSIFSLALAVTIISGQHNSVLASNIISLTCEPHEGSIKTIGLPKDTESKFESKPGSLAVEFNSSFLLIKSGGSKEKFLLSQKSESGYIFSSNSKTTSKEYLHDWNAETGHLVDVATKKFVSPFFKKYATKDGAVSYEEWVLDRESWTVIDVVYSPVPGENLGKHDKHGFMMIEHGYMMIETTDYRRKKDKPPI